MSLVLIGLFLAPPEWHWLWAEIGEGRSAPGSLESRERTPADFARQFNQAFQGTIVDSQVAQPPNLAFRAALSDENGNGFIEPGELIRLAVSVVNTGPGPALDVKLRISGNSRIATSFPPMVPKGTVPSGASCAETLSLRMPKTLVSEDGKTLVVRVEEKRPEWSPTGEAVLPVRVRSKAVTEKERRALEDVDLVPERRHSLDAAFGVVVAIGRYQHRDLPTLPYVRHDGEVVAQYLMNVCGIKPENLLTLYDEQATSENLESLLVSQLPARLMPGDKVYIYLAGI
ncbi:MAG: hypothetical protein ABIK62_04645, partial [candidate division WOR-3 bacterium]